MDRDAITVLLIARTPEHKGIGSFGAYVSNADALYEELLAKGAKILGRPVSHPWGLRDFRVIDLEGTASPSRRRLNDKAQGSKVLKAGMKAARHEAQRNAGSQI